MSSLITKTHHAIKAVLSHFTVVEKVAFSLCVTLLIISSFVLVHKTSNSFSVVRPAQGGSFSEGLIGAPKFINPVLATSQTDKDLVKLIYSGLLKKTEFGIYEPDLAECDFSNEKEITCIINDKAKFQNGDDVTAEDVVFTITTLKELSSRNPIGNRWAKISVLAQSDKTVLFRLPDNYSGFEDQLTQGILSKRLWSNFTAEDIENSPLNLEPIGSGPFKFVSYITKKDNTGIIHLRRFSRALKPAFLNSISFEIYPDTDSLFTGIRKGEVDGGLLPDHVDLPKRLKNREHTLLTSQIYSLFINQKNAKSFESLENRKKLTLLINQFQQSSYWPTWLIASNSLIPLPIDNTNNRGILDSQERDISVPTLEIATSHSPELILLADSLKSFLATTSNTAQVSIFERGEIVQRQVRNREFSLLMFGTTYQHPADAFSFWHSSQRNDPGLNITNFASSSVDATAESLIHENDNNKRVALLKTLDTQLHNDIPAIPLVRGSFQYILPKAITAKLITISSPEERFSTISSWYTRTSRKFSFTNH